MTGKDTIQSPEGEQAKRPLDRVLARDQPEDEVRLTVPPEQRYLRLIRLAATSIAAAADFDVEAIEDVRIVVDELCSALLEWATGPIELAIRVTVDEFRCGAAAPGTPPDGEAELLDPLRSTIVRALTDEYEFYGGADGRVHCGFVKRISATQD
jgi:serine/threonine-protein kinase RsbW